MFKLRFQYCLFSVNVNYRWVGWVRLVVIPAEEESGVGASTSTPPSLGSGVPAPKVAQECAPPEAKSSQVPSSAGGTPSPSGKKDDASEQNHTDNSAGEIITAPKAKRRRSTNQAAEALAHEIPAEPAGDGVAKGVAEEASTEAASAKGVAEEATTEAASAKAFVPDSAGDPLPPLDAGTSGLSQPPIVPTKDEEVAGRVSGSGLCAGCDNVGAPEVDESALLLLAESLSSEDACLEFLTRHFVVPHAAALRRPLQRCDSHPEYSVDELSDESDFLETTGPAWGQGWTTMNAQDTALSHDGLAGG